MSTHRQKIAIQGPRRTAKRVPSVAGPRADMTFWSLVGVLAILTLGGLLEYVRLQTEQVKMGASLEQLASVHSEQDKALSNLDSKVQKYQSNTRYIEQAIRDFELDLKGNTQANVVKVDAYGSVLRQPPRDVGNGFLAGASR